MNVDEAKQTAEAAELNMLRADKVAWGMKVAQLEQELTKMHVLLSKAEAEASVAWLWHGKAMTIIENMSRQVTVIGREL